jgi:hypothetical protein
MSLPINGLMTIVPVEEVIPAKRRMICRAALIGLLAFITTACASFPENRLPKVDGISTQAQVSNKPSAYLALRFMVDFSGGEKPGVETTGPLPMLRQVVEKVATESALFRSYTFESFQVKNMDHVLQIEMTNYGSAGKAVGAGLITGLTLFLIPTAATDNYKLTAKLFDRNGQLLKTYSYDDGVTTWFGIWLIPMADNTPQSVVLGVWENMIRTLFRDVLNDGLLS